MSEYYKGKRSRNIYSPTDDNPFKLSRSKIDLFMECPRCFYIDRRLGLGRPPGFPFALNSAVDSMLKKEFDALRENGGSHPLLEQFGVDAKPALHDMIDEWRENFKGVQYLHKPTNLIITGAIDDLWINSKDEYIVADYKATAKADPVTEIGDAAYHNSYRRQLEVYQWLLRRNGLNVSDMAYWVYCTGNPNEESFDAVINFDIHVISHEGSDGWVEPTILELKKTLDSDVVPEADPDCDYCLYWNDRDEVVKEAEAK